MKITANQAKTSMPYDYFEGVSAAAKWWGATTNAYWSNAFFTHDMTGIANFFAATGKVVERAFDRVQSTPNWNIADTVIDGKTHPVGFETIIDKPFGSLTHFEAMHRSGSKARKVFLAAPLSGHHATLIRNTVIGLLPHADVYVAEWKNARDVPVSEGKFDVEDYTLYLIDYMKQLGPDLHVVAICQPAPLALAATALLAEDKNAYQPATLTLMGGPIDTSAAPTEVTHFSDRASLEQIERFAIYPVGSNFAGKGRLVYPGALQLAAFMSMNANKHRSAHWNQIFDIAKNDAAKTSRHNAFYDEYLSVMDMTAEFYLSTVKRVFQDRELANGNFTVNGQLVDPGNITDTAVLTIEGGRDDITAPGQCVAALNLLTGLKACQKQHYLEADAGHYGIFSGGAWRNKVLPRLIEFIVEHEDQIEEA